MSSSNTGYIPVEDRAFKMVQNDDRPLKILNAPENMSAAIMRLQNFDNRFLYVVKYLDKNYPTLKWAISGRNLKKLMK